MAVSLVIMAAGLGSRYGGSKQVDGIGPNDIEINSLVERVQAHDEIEEVILALSSTMEGDTTNFYISRKLAPLGVKVSVIARGISVGNELEYTDEVTLAGRSSTARRSIPDLCLAGSAPPVPVGERLYSAACGGCAADIQMLMPGVSGSSQTGGRWG